MEDKKNEFEKNSALLLFLSLIGNACSYIYQIIMGNMLSTADFGVLNTLLTLSMVLGLPFGILNVVAVRFSAKYSAENEQGKLTHLMHSLSKISILCSLLFLVLGIVFSQYISDYLKIDNKSYIIAAVFVASLNCITIIAIGFVQGLKKFMSYGIYTIMTILCKLLLGVLFTILGFGILGNLAAVYIGSILAIAYCFYCVKDVFFRKNLPNSKLDLGDIRHYIVLVFIAQMISQLLINGDILLVKAYASTVEEVGIYSSAMVIGRIPFYFSGAFVTALFPIVAEKTAQGKDTRVLFVKSLVYGGGVAVAGAAVLVLLGDFVVSILFGTRYSAAAQLLLPIGCLTVAISLITILMNYLLARGKTIFFTITLILGLLCILVLIELYHQTVAQMVYIMALTLGVVFILNAVAVFKSKNS